MDNGTQQGCITHEGNLYLLKTSRTVKSIYEFPSYEQEVNALMKFVYTKDKRRNAVYEETPNQVHDTLQMYTKLKKLNDIIL